MKICYIAVARSGHTRRWVGYFAKKHEIDLVTLSYTKKEDTFVPEEVYEKMGVRVHKVSKKMPFLLLAPFKIRNLIKKIKPDLVHAHSVTINGFCGAFSGFHPVVISAWGGDVLVNPDNSKILKMMVKFALKKADLTTCDGDNSKEAMIKLGEDSQKIKIVYHGVDTKEFNLKQQDRKLREELKIFDSPTVISTRGLEPIYNVESLINAIPLVLKQVPDAKFVIANNGSQEAHLKEMAKSLCIWNSVKFVGLIQHNELPRYIASLDVYVSTSLSDGGIAISTIEAMACGLAPVVTDVGDNKRWIKDGKNGFIIPIKNTKALAERITYLLKNKDIRKEFGNINRKIIEEKQNYYKEMEKMENIYKELIERYKS